MAEKNIDGNVIKLKNVRLSFPKLDKPGVPKGYENSPPKFSGTALLDPNNDEHRMYIKEISAEINRLIKEAWGEKPAKFKPIADYFGKGELCRDKQGAIYKGYEGMWFVKGNSYRRPLCLGKQRENLTPEEALQTLYPGCFIDMNIHFYADKVNGPAVRCTLRGVRFRKDGEEFGAGAVSADEFDDDLGEGEVDLEEDIDF